MKDFKNPTIFVVEDDPAFSTLIKKELQRHNFTNVEVFSTGDACLKKISEHPDIVLLDYALGKTGMNGLEVLKRIKAQSPQTQVIMLTAYDKLEIAIDSVKNGAYDYVLKSETAFERLNNLIKRIIKQNEIAMAHKKLTKKRNIVLTIIALVAVLTGLLYFFYINLF